MGAVKKGIRRLLVGGALVAAALALLVLTGVLHLPGRGAAHSGAGSPGQGKRSEQQPVAVTVAPVTPRPIRRTVTMVGNLQGYEEITITPEVEGKVVDIHFDIGDVVKPGDTLLEIEDVKYHLAVAEAQRALEAELAKLGLAELPKGALDVDRVPTVVRAAAVEKNARVKLSRADSLRSRGAISAEDFDQIQADYDVARAMKDQAVKEAQATFAGALYRRAQLDSARQRLSETKVRVPTPSEERLRLARERLRGAILPPDAEIKASDVKFVVAQRMVSKGEMVRAFPSVAVFRLVIDHPLKLVAAIPERHVGEVKVGQPVGLVVEAYPNEVFKGMVGRVNPTVDRNSRSFVIEVDVPNESRRLKAGSFAKAAVVTREDKNAVTVPPEALVTFAGVTKVFVVEDGKARAVPVKPGQRPGVQAEERTGSWVEVIGDLRPGSQVVTSGHSQLAEGTPVRVRPAAQRDAGQKE